MIQVGKLEQMAEELRLYDVVDGGWEHEHKGPDFNIRHVGLHLSDVIGRKDFSDPETVKDEIAPDSIQYALRLARWCEIDVCTILPWEETRVEAVHKSRELEIPLVDYVAIVIANAEIAKNRHDIDHVKSQLTAEEQAPKSMRRAAQMLLFSVERQVDDFGFDPQEVFNARIESLRTRFNVPRLHA